jgi:hypothetical protein
MALHGPGRDYDVGVLNPPAGLFPGARQHCRLRRNCNSESQSHRVCSDSRSCDSSMAKMLETGKSGAAATEREVPNSNSVGVDPPRPGRDRL